MAFSLKLKRSAGVRVTGAVHRLIARGNAARERRDWPAAATAYGEALAGDPALAHIWIQLGHALKEGGSPERAEEAYLRAAALRPDSGDIALHLGHVARLTGDEAQAGRHYFRAVQVEPGNADAVTELHRLIARSSGAPREAMVALLKRGLIEHEPAEGEPAEHDPAEPLAGAARTARSAIGETIGRRMAADGSEGGGEGGGGAEGAKVALIFDASDLIGYYSHARLPTGIQRVQIEAITSALQRADRPVRICCFIEGRDDWLEVPVRQFHQLTRLSLQSGERHDPEWTVALNRLYLTLTLADPFQFPDGAYLVNLGTSWWLHNYFLFVRAAKARHGIRYIPFVHDFIPIIAPEHCLKGLTQDFISWAIGVFSHASHYLVNSEATKRDLLKVADILGATVDPDDIAVIRLDADFRKPEARRLGRERLAGWRLDREPFVLFVSTIESRKGHVVAMDAWLELIRRHGARRVPRLVCVGKNGWLNEAVYLRLQHNDALAGRVTMLSDLSDEELALLYRSCRFTIYPSLYEGWGLPITEALCHGRPVVAADSSSLPEAGGDFAVFVEAGSPGQLADAVERMSFDDAWRAGWEARIAAGFRPRSWAAVAHQIDDEIIRLADRDADAAGRTGKAPVRAPPARLGAYHPITRNVATRIWPGIGSGEIFRAGLGWLWPDDWGCWTRPQGGALAIGVPAGHGPLRVYLLLRNIPGHACPWHLDIAGRPSLHGVLGEGERKWVTIDYPPADDNDGDDDGDGVLRMRLRGDCSGTIRMTIGGAEKEHLASVGVAGFFICEAGDAAARASLLEAVALGNVAELDAYREQVPAAGSGRIGG